MDRSPENCNGAPKRHRPGGQTPSLRVPKVYGYVAGESVRLSSSDSLFFFERIGGMKTQIDEMERATLSYCLMTVCAGRRLFLL